jgi:hypothetical protein
MLPISFNFYLGRLGWRQPFKKPKIHCWINSKVRHQVSGHWNFFRLMWLRLDLVIEWNMKGPKDVRKKKQK